MVEFNLLKMMNYFCTSVYKKDTALYLQYDFDKKCNYRAYRSVSLQPGLHLITHPCDQPQVYYSTRKQINRSAVSLAISIPLLAFYYLIFCVKICENNKIKHYLYL